MIDRTRPVFIDTCVLLYAAGRHHPYKEPCVALLEAVADRRIDAAINTDVLQEVLYRFHAISKIATGREVAAAALTLFEKILPVTDKEMGRALAILEKHPALSPRDAVHVATMQTADIKIIVSADRHFDVVQGIARIEPGEVLS